MRITKPSYEIIPQGDGMEGIYKQIELCGRTCYKSSDKVEDGSAKPFVERMVSSGHCYTGDTEVLTDIGWVRFRDYKGEKVAVVNPDTCEFVGFEYPKGYINKKYRGLGLSKYLLNNGINYIKENYNQNTLIADIKKSNARSISFFEAMGFKKEYEIRNGSALRFIYRG